MRIPYRTRKTPRLCDSFVLDCPCISQKKSWRCHARDTEATDHPPAIAFFYSQS